MQALCNKVRKYKKAKMKIKTKKSLAIYSTSQGSQIFWNI